MNTQVVKKCPLCFAIANTKLISFGCLEKNCAWWNFIDEECSVATLGTLATIDIGGRER